MSDLDELVEAALAGALGDVPVGDPPAEPVRGASTAADGDLGGFLDNDVDAEVHEGAVLDGGGTVAATGDAAEVEVCSEAEARELLDRARQAIETLDQTMTQIVRRRAWIPLGYDNPQQFWIREFGPGSGYSRQHLYRTARVLSLLYGLTERLGDDAAALDITERSLRALPAGKGGDDELIDQIASAVEQLGDGATPDSIQQAVDETLLAAKKEATRTKQREETSLVDLEQLAGQLSALGIDPSMLHTSDDEPVSGPSGGRWGNPADHNHDHDGHDADHEHGPHTHTHDDDDWDTTSDGDAEDVDDGPVGGTTLDEVDGGDTGWRTSYAIDLVNLTKALDLLSVIEPNLAVSLPVATPAQITAYKDQVAILRNVADQLARFTPAGADDEDDPAGLEEIDFDV